MPEEFYAMTIKPLHRPEMFEHVTAPLTETGIMDTEGLSAEEVFSHVYKAAIIRLEKERGLLPANPSVEGASIQLYYREINKVPKS